MATPRRSRPPLMAVTAVAAAGLLLAVLTEAVADEPQRECSAGGDLVEPAAAGPSLIQSGARSDRVPDVAVEAPPASVLLELLERASANESAAVRATPPEDLFGDSLEPFEKGGKHEEHHGYLALVFFFGVLVIGCLILVFLERCMRGALPYTCALFVAGMLTSLIHQYNVKGSWFHWPVWFLSLDMWQSIDPHTLFFAFLPPLLFGEAMRLNVRQALCCLPQVLVLACPGVLLGAWMTAMFAMYAFPYGWDWNIALVFGSILSATDPVAVVALFNTLGVSPRLTMLVSGESLLNDGTAIVVFTLVLKVALGAPVETWGALAFFGHMTLTALLLGAAVGLLAVSLIGVCAEDFHHSDAMVQVIVSICCGYVAFIVGEVQVETSGVITAVCAGFAVAYLAWPRFTSRETITIVWETIEFIANTVIFFLAGVLFANTVLDRWGFIGWADCGWCLLLYVALTLIRAIMIYVMWIPLNLVGSPLSWTDAVVMIWSGMRGAISLSLAIIVDMEPGISKERGSRIMFHVGGVATLTFLVNATTAPLLLKLLGVTKSSHVKERTISRLAQAMLQEAREGFERESRNADDVRFCGANEHVVQAMMRPPGGLGALPSDFSSDEEISEQALAQIYREMHLKVVQHHYWEAIDSGILPRNLLVARTLLQSVDEALESAWHGLADWDAVLRVLSAEDLEDPGPLIRVLGPLAETWPFSYVPALRRWWGRDFRAKRVVYAVLSFQDAHLHAQAQVPQYCGTEDPLDVRVHKQVREESVAQCARATALLQRLPQQDVEVGKSEMLARKLLHSQIRHLREMKEKGVLTSVEAGHLEGRCLASLRRIGLASKAAWLDEVEKASRR